MKKYILLLLVATFISSCKKESSTTGISQPDIILDDSKFVKFEKDNYSIQYPKDWLIEKEFGQDVAFYIYLNVDKEEAEIGSNINLMVQNVSKEMTLEEYTSISLKDISRQGSVISSEKFVTPSKEYQRVVCTMRMYNEDLKFVQHYIVKNSKVYVLTFTAMERNYSRFESIAEQVMQSFTIK